MGNLTEQHLLGLQPKDQAYDVQDGDGLAIRVFPNGIKTWVYLYQVGEYDRRRTLGIFPDMTLDQARAELPEARKIGDMAQNLEHRESFHMDETVPLATAASLPLWQRGNVIAAAAAAALAFIALSVLITTQHEPLTTTLGAADAASNLVAATTEETTVAPETSPEPKSQNHDDLSEVRVSVAKRPVLGPPAPAPKTEKHDDLSEVSVSVAKRPELEFPLPPPEDAEPLPPEPKKIAAESVPTAATALDPTTTGAVRRAQFTSAIANREPVDTLEDVQLAWTGTEPKYFHFFTEFYGVEGQTLSHNWYLNSKIQSTVDFTVGSPYRWRVYSKKRVTSDLIGEWRVDVVNQVGDVIHSDTFNLLPKRTIADSQ